MMTVESMVIVYESREPETFVEKVRDYLGDIKTVRSILPVGDYLVSGIPIERKEPEDFIASIFDGRLNNQLYDLSRSCNLSILAIVGDIWRAADEKNDPVTLSAVASALAGCWYRRSDEGNQGIVIPIQFKDNEHFALFIKGLVKKDRVRRPKLTKTKVSDNDTLVRTVASFPMWGEDLAKAGLREFGSIEGLVSAEPKEVAKRINGVAKKKAQMLHNHFRRKYEIGEDR
ncbi:MAG: ERCC4 domain-containing protein [Candidatus Thorarchaeota archaeon]|jgi:ERCC4-type nuclease